MGMYDSVFVQCPGCRRMIEFQSKTGDCLLKKYHSNSVPLNIAVALDGAYKECSDCGTIVKIESQQKIPRVKMSVETENSDWD